MAHGLKCTGLRKNELEKKGYLRNCIHGPSILGFPSLSLLFRGHGVSMQSVGDRLSRNGVWEGQCARFKSTGLATRSKPVIASENQVGTQVTLKTSYSVTSNTRLTSQTCEPAMSSRTGIKSSSSLSWASENQLLMGIACCG